MGQYSAVSGIQVIDRTVIIINALSAGPLSLNELCEATQLPRATTHRLASALEAHRIVARDDDGRWTIGPWLRSFNSPHRAKLLDAAEPIMHSLVSTTGESVQLYRLTGNTRTCIAAVEPTAGLRNTVPVGSQLPLTSGSAAKIFAAYGATSPKPWNPEALAEIRSARVADSVAEREVGLASLSAPILDSAEELVAVLSISGPADRLKPSPASLWGEELKAAAEALSAQT